MTPQNLIIAGVTIIGTFVMMALHDVTAAVGMPVVVGIAGIHIGATVSGANVTGVTRNQPPNA